MSSPGRHFTNAGALLLALRLGRLGSIPPGQFLRKATPHYKSHGVEMERRYRTPTFEGSMQKLDLAEVPPFLELLSKHHYSPSEACEVLFVRRGYLTYLARRGFLEVQRHPPRKAKGAIISGVTATALARFMVGAYRVNPARRFAVPHEDPPRLLASCMAPHGIAVKPLYSRVEVATVLGLGLRLTQSLVTRGFLPGIVAPRGAQNRVLCVVATDLAAFITAQGQALKSRLEATEIPRKDEYSPKDVARILNINPATVGRLVNQGRLCRLNGADLRISIESIQKTLEESIVRRMCQSEKKS